MDISPKKSLSSSECSLDLSFKVTILHVKYVLNQLFNFEFSPNLHVFIIVISLRADNMSLLRSQKHLDVLNIRK